MHFSPLPPPPQNEKRHSLRMTATPPSTPISKALLSFPLLLVAITAPPHIKYMHVFAPPFCSSRTHSLYGYTTTILSLSPLPPPTHLARCGHQYLSQPYSSILSLSLFLSISLFFSLSFSFFLSPPPPPLLSFNVCSKTVTCLARLYDPTNRAQRWVSTPDIDMDDDQMNDKPKVCLPCNTHLF